MLVLAVLLLPLGLYFLAPAGQGRQALTLPQNQDVLKEDSALAHPMVRAWGRLNSLVGDSGNSQVVVGKEGWLYFRPALSSTLGENRLGKAGLQALADQITQISQALSARGTRFVLLIAPDKAQVYPQFLPPYVKPNPEQVTDRQALLSLLKLHQVLAPDLAAMFRETPQTLYLKTDTHWNALGAYTTFQSLCDEAGFAIKPALTLMDFSVPTAVPGDLLPLYLPGAADKQVDYLAPAQNDYSFNRPFRTLDDLRIQTKSPSGGPKVYVARDSFGRAIFPYFASFASELTFVRDFKQFTQKASGAELAVIIIAERNLPQLLLDLQTP